MRNFDFGKMAFFKALPIIALAGAASAADSGMMERHPEVMRHFGQIEFFRHWVSSPQNSTWDGLGPLFNESSCASCHRGPAMGGRFHVSGGNRAHAAGLVVRFGDENGRRDPLYGEQLQTNAVPGVRAEGRVNVVIPEGLESTYELHVNLTLGALDEGIAKAPLITPALVGRGALEAVDPEAIEAMAAQQAEQEDGISGQVRWVPSAGGPAIGRYGYKADHPSLFNQIAYALLADMGLSSTLLPYHYGECTAQQTSCIDAPHGPDAWRGGVEVSDHEINTLVAYIASLEAPAQSASDLAVNRSFVDIGCSTCHVPVMPSRDGGEVVVFSDLLLHDLGPDFDNGIGAPGVSPSQWRTAPLLAMEPYRGRRYLHDGRAADIDTAIRFHGGDALSSRQSYERLDETTRQELIAFIEGL